jgi:hypothetical protein
MQGIIMDIMIDSILAGEGRAPEIILIAEGFADRSDARRAVKAVGHGISRELTTDEAPDWFATAPTADMILVELDRGDSVAEQALQAASRHSTATGVPLIIASPLEALDRAFRAANGPQVTWLCAPQMADRLTACAMTLDRPPMLNDVNAEVDPQRLRRLADEVSRIARALSSLSSTEDPVQSYAAQAVSDVQIGFRAQPALFEDRVTMPSSEEVRKIIRLRRLRDRFFDPALFADPAWDMLLDLLAARIEHGRVAVSSLCIAAAVPPTTALRWIKAMTDHALFERCADPEDGRRIFIQLSDKAMHGMGRYFEAAKKAGGVLI